MSQGPIPVRGGRSAPVSSRCNTKAYTWRGISSRFITRRIGGGLSFAGSREGGSVSGRFISVLRILRWKQGLRLS